MLVFVDLLNLPLTLLDVQHKDGAIGGTRDHVLRVRRYRKLRAIGEAGDGVVFMLERRLVDFLPLSAVPYFDHVIMACRDDVVFIGCEAGAGDVREVGVFNGVDDLFIFGVPELQHLQMRGAEDGF